MDETLMKLELEIHGYEGNGVHFVHVITNLPHQEPPLLDGWTNGTKDGDYILWGSWLDRDSPGEALRLAFKGISNLLATVEVTAPSRKARVTFAFDVVPEPHECPVCGVTHEA